MIEGREMLSIDHGDLNHYSISAASIMLQVTRDRIMDMYAKEYPEYLLKKMQDMVQRHIEAINRYGICDVYIGGVMLY